MMANVCRLCKHLIVPGDRTAPLSPRTHLMCAVANSRRPREERTPPPPYSLTRAVSAAPRAVVAPNPKREQHRERSLLDLAHEVHFCANCAAYAPDGCEPAHANGAEWGKGLSQKADDFAHAALCHPCHRFLDQGGAPLDPSGRFACTRQDRREMWTRAYFETQTQYHRNGWVGVINKTKGNK